MPYSFNSLEGGMTIAAVGSSSVLAIFTNYLFISSAQIGYQALAEIPGHNMFVDLVGGANSELVHTLQASLDTGTDWAMNFGMAMLCIGLGIAAPHFVRRLLNDYAY